MDKRKKLLVICGNIVFPLLGLVLFFTWGLRILVFFMPFLLGFGISWLVSPLVEFLEKHGRLHRKHSSLAMIGLILLLFSGILLGIGYLVCLAVRQVLSLAPVWLGAIQSEAAALLKKISSMFSSLPGGNWGSFSESLREYSSSALKLVTEPVGNLFGGLVVKVPEILILTVFTLIAAYVFTAERERVRIWLRNHTSPQMKKILSLAREDIKKLIYGYFGAQLRIMLLMMAAMGVGLTVLGSPYALFWAVLIGLFDFLPLFGAGAVLLPWALAKALNGQFLFALGLVVLYIGTQIIKNIIQPKMVGSSVGMHPLVTLLCVYIGFRLWGLGGMILAIPAGMVCIKIYEYGILDGFLHNCRRLMKEIKEFKRRYE